MQLAIDSNSLSQDTAAAISRAAALGFTMIELNLQPAEFDYGYRRKVSARFYRRLREQLDSAGVSVWSVTPPPLNQRQMFFERARKDILMGAAIAAGILGARVYAVEPANIFSSEMAFNTYLRERTAPPMVEGYDESWVQAANRQVSTAILNIDYWMGIPLTNQVDHIKRVTEDLAIGWAMDIPMALRRNTLAAWLEGAGKRMAVAYAYDLTEDGLPTLPTDESWQQTLPALATSTLKTVVIRGGLGCSDEEILACRRALQDILS
jgi:sugar phosphate isomerase/epimerase